METNNQSRLEQVQAEISEKGREIWLAGLGALATVGEEGSKLYGNLVERGKDFADKTRKLEDDSSRFVQELIKKGESFQENNLKRLNAAVDDVTSRQNKMADKLEDSVSTVVEKTLERLEVPTRTETLNLTEKVEALTKQVEALAQALEAQNKKAPARKAPAKKTAAKAATTEA